MKNKKVMAKSVLALLMCAVMLASTVLVGGVGVIAVSAAEATTPETVAEADDLLEITGTSRQEVVEHTGKMGLGFRFNLQCEGVTISDTHEGNYTNATVNGNKLIAVGALMSNNPLVGGDEDAFVLGNASDTNGSKVINIKAKYLFGEYHQEYYGQVRSGITYAVRITNIPEGFNAADIYARAYYVYEKDGVQTTVYDDVYVADYAQTDEITYTQPAAKFKKNFNKNFLYRVGNEGSVKLGTLFAGENVNGVSVKVETVDNTGASGTYTAANAWNDGAIDFNGTGVVKVSIAGDSYSAATTVLLEVVDATNATGAASATANNVVLLKDAGFGSLEVSNGYTLYGNGFTLKCGSDSPALDFGYSFVTLDNGTLDNVQIECPNFDYAALYQSQMKSSENRSETTDRTRYYNVKSAVAASGNSQILNSRISGGRAALNATGGNILVDNSRLELGALATVLIGATNSFTFRDTVLVQEPTPSTYDPNKILIGFSVLAVCDANNIPTINIEGDFVQKAWADESYSQYVPSSAKSVVQTVLSKNDFKHDLDGDGTKESVNLGFAFMSADEYGSVSYNDVTIKNTDNRTNRDAIPYETTSVSSAAVYSYLSKYNNKEYITDSSYKTVLAYEPNRYSDIVTVDYADSVDGWTVGKTFGTDGWVHELNVDLDKLSGYLLDFDKVTMKVNGIAVSDFTVNGGAKPAPAAVTVGGTIYTLTATANGKEYTALFKVTGTETSKESPSKISGPTTAGFGVAKSYGGDWSGAADVLTGVKIKYWSVAEKDYVEYDFTGFKVPGNAGKLNGTNSYWEYTPDNKDFTLKVTNTVAIHSGKSVYGMPIRGTDEKLYFTISSTDGYVGSGTSSRAITMQYEFTDNNGGEKLTFTHTFNINYDKDNQYSYSDLSGSGKLTKLAGSSGGGGGCVTPDTLVTLADGSQVRVDSLTGDEMLLVWNMETGKYEAAPIVFVDSEEEAEYDIVHLYFSDGSDVKVIYEHGFFDLDLGKYVYIDATNYADYIGHKFVTGGDVTADDWNVATLDNVVIEREITTAWSPVTFGHLCYYTNGVLSMPGGVYGLFNIFEVDTDTMTYDAEQMQKDIETYGLLTLEDFGGMITEEAFEAFNGKYLAVAMGKGLLTWEDIAYMAERYIPLM